MATPLSVQLSTLSERAKQAEDSVSAAKTGSSGRNLQRDAEMKASAAQRKDEMHRHVDEAEASISSEWAGITEKVESDIDGIRTKIDFKKYEHDRNKAVKAAGQAEANAVRAIGFALDSVDYAETAMLDAVLARMNAETY